MEFEALAELARALGFTRWGALDPAALEFRQEVRDMCAADRCRSYGRNWTCPPACGTLDEAAARAGRFHRGILLQTTGALADDFDAEGMARAERLHKARFLEYAGRVRAACPACLPLGAGACTLCPACTCPRAPCRFPERAVPSMEAYGLWVSDVCARSGLGYYYGPRTVTYTSCVLL